MCMAGIWSLLDLLVMGLGVVNLFIGLLAMVVDRVDVTVWCIFLAGFGVVGGAGAPMARSCTTLPMYFATSWLRQSPNLAQWVGAGEVS